MSWRGRSWWFNRQREWRVYSNPQFKATEPRKGRLRY